MATPRDATAGARVNARAGRRDSLLWAISWAALGLALFMALIAVRSTVAALIAGNGAKSPGLGLLASLYLFPFALVVWLAIGLPALVVIAVAWNLLCRRRVVADTAANVARLGLTLGLVVASGLLLLQRFEVSRHPVDALETFVIVVLAVAVGGVMPRMWFARLAMGRFGAAER